MNRILILFAGLAVLAGPASARDIAVPIIGRDDAAVKQDIRKAAREVCRDALYDGVILAMSGYRCVSRLIAKGDSDLAKARIVNAQVAASARYAAAK